MTTSNRASRAQSRRDKETHTRKRCPNRKDRKINIQRANFEQHSEGLETASVALELDDVYELDEMFFCTLNQCISPTVLNSQGSNYPYEPALKLPGRAALVD